MSEEVIGAGKVAVVTGAASGIGRALAETFAREGSAVVIADHDTEHAEEVAAGIARAVRPGGRIALSAFNAYFSVKYQTDAEFDADGGIAHEHAEVHDESGALKAVELWTGCYTPKELRLLMRAAGLAVDAIHSVEPGRYAADPPTTESPEYLVLATRRTI